MRVNIAMLYSLICITTLLMWERSAHANDEGIAIIEKTNAYIQQLVTDKKVPSVAVIASVNGDTVFSGAFGYANSVKQTKTTLDTPYPLASLSKPIIATGVMALVEHGELTLESSDFSLGSYDVASLLNHTSGLPTFVDMRWADNSRQVTLEKSLQRFGFRVHQQGIVSEYSNLGYGMLGQLIENTAQIPLGTYLKNTIFSPLDMKNASIRTSYSVPKGAAQKYAPNGEILPPSYSNTPGAGDVYASATDIIKFANFHLGILPAPTNAPIGDTLRVSMVNTKHSEALFPYYSNTYYGLGWYVLNNTQKTVWHEGGMPGASTLLVMQPSTKTAIAVLINTNDANSTAQDIARTITANFSLDLALPSFNATHDLVPLDASFAGKWQGTINVDGDTRAIALVISDAGKTALTLKDKTGEKVVNGQLLHNGDAVLGTFALNIDATGIQSTTQGFGLARLIRNGDTLSGTLVAYASLERLEYLYPFKVHLNRVAP